MPGNSKNDAAKKQPCQETNVLKPVAYVLRPHVRKDFLGEEPTESTALPTVGGMFQKQSFQGRHSLRSFVGLPRLGRAAVSTNEALMPGRPGDG